MSRSIVGVMLKIRTKDPFKRAELCFRKTHIIARYLYVVVVLQARFTASFSESGTVLSLVTPRRLILGREAMAFVPRSGKIGSTGS